MPPVTIKPDLNNPSTLVDPVTGLPMTPFEIDQLRHVMVNEMNAKRERFRIRAANDRRGFKEPKIGQELHVQLDSSISRRTRAGMRFEKSARLTLTVVSDDEYAAAKAINAAAPVITVLGAEQIFEDTALHTFEAPMSDAGVAELRAKAEDLERQLAAERESHASTARALEVMKARRAAPESTDGKPNKLAAQAAARAGDAQTSAPAPKAGAPAPSNDFGGPAKDEK